MSKELKDLQWFSLENRIKMIWLLLQTAKGMSKEDIKLFFCNFGSLKKMNLLVLVDHKEVFPDHGGDT